MNGAGNNLYLTVQGTTICYDDVGQSQVPIIFIHGFPFDKSSWEPQITALENDYRVIAYDIRGFGKSAANQDVPSINLYADDLIHLMEHLNIPKAIVCGISMGGYIILNALKRFPEKFEAAILCDTQCIADSDETKEKRKDSIAQVMSGQLMEFATGFVKKVFSAEVMHADAQLKNRIQNIILSTSPETIVGGLTALKNREETCASLPDIHIPVLILCGSDDVITPPIQSETLNRGIKDSDYQLIPKAGHLSNLDQPFDFNQKIRLFIMNVLNKITL